MSRMNIVSLAKQAGFTVANGSYGVKFSGGDLERFAELVVATERERLAATFDRQDVAFYGSAIAESLRRVNGFTYPNQRERNATD